MSSYEKQIRFFPDAGMQQAALSDYYDHGEDCLLRPIRESEAGRMRNPAAHPLPSRCSLPATLLNVTYWEWIVAKRSSN